MKNLHYELYRTFWIYSVGVNTRFTMTHIVKFVFTLTCTQKFNKLEIYYMKLQTVILCFTILRLAYDGKRVLFYIFEFAD